MKILISGASGLIGKALAGHLVSSGHRVGRLVRRPPRGEGEFEWDPAAGRLDPRVVAGHDAVVNLSGSPLRARPWTRSSREQLYSSRVASTRTLAGAINQLETPPKVFISQSGSGIYGDRGDEVLTEASAVGSSPVMADVCQRWEEAALQASCPTIVTRTGVVLTPRGGALPRMLLPLRLGLGGPLGSGRQWWPWITMADEVRALAFLLESGLSGPVNVCAPVPAQVDRLVSVLAAELHRPAKFRVPQEVLTTVLPGLAENIILASQRMLPERLEAAGFEFDQANPQVAVRWIHDELGRRS
ncbi:TIGR01777 family oxidoreductase [Arthrobacter crystallopoietes]|uniref:TIGR01777 family oxidoreductase n=1 Tax=Crystallibacter crystallopoietes TaxID=37928 RepID=UPI001ABEA0F1|nr:TIGR01777 family oxidoreductase [Arthrobacter crystallopoietes]QTG79936.1 TIGR01777 family oxidoreductase [Arthrobacter crystallopoietes]